MHRDKALKHLRGSLRSSSRGEELMPMQKVSVMADSEEGLEQGLDKAKDIVEQIPGDLEADSDEALEGEMYDEAEGMEGEEDLQELLASVSPEKAAELIEMLKAKLV